MVIALDTVWILEHVVKKDENTFLEINDEEGLDQ